MRIEPLHAGAEEEWDAFCRAEPTAWFWHTMSWTRWLIAAKPDLKTRSLAFTVRDGRDLVAVVPLALERGEFALGGAPCWAPAVRHDLSESDVGRVLRRVLDHTDALAAEHGAARTSFQVSPLTDADFAVEAIRAGYLDIGRTSQVLDLTLGVDALRRAMSKGHRAAVKRGAAQFAIDILSGAAATNVALHEFRTLHEAAAGRQTRPSETFDDMADWAQRGDGVLALARGDAGYVGGSYVNILSGRAYYLAAAMDRSLSHQPIGHALQWALIEWLVARGVARYELGLQQFGPRLHEVPTDKERNISRFKRGFGGTLRLAPAWEKWYDAAAFATANAARAQSYASALEQMRATTAASTD